MFRRTCSSFVRVLVVSMLPDGGCMTAAMTNLGFTPYTFTTPFAAGNGGTHPTEWCEVLTGKKKVNMSFFDKYDCLIGPPAAILYKKILAASPAYTKVVLVEEPDPRRWAADMETYYKPLLASAERIKKHSTVGQHVTTMLQHMFVQELSPQAGGYAAALEEFEDAVRRDVAPDRLLVWRYGEGYEPLMDFLRLSQSSEDDDEDGASSSSSLRQQLLSGDVVFPPYESGMESLSRLTDRLNRAREMAKFLFIIMLGLLFLALLPVLQAGRGTMEELYRDYRIAFDDAESNNDNDNNNSSGENERRKVTDLRSAMILAKDVTVNFEEKWKGRGALSVVTNRGASPEEEAEGSSSSSGGK